LISFRYHLVSIVALFLALALGVLVGTTVVNRGVLDLAQAQANTALKRADNLRKLVGELQDQVSTWERFGNEIQPVLVAGQLTGRSIVLVTAQGVDLSEVNGVAGVLQDSAGASVMGTLVVTPKMKLSDEGSQATVAKDLGLVASDPRFKLQSETAQALAERLARGRPVTGEDPLQALVRDGFLTFRAGDADLSTVGGPSQAVVVLSGGPSEPAVDPSLFFQPLVEGLIGAGVSVAAAETSFSAYPFVALIRDGALDGRLVTVDDAETTPGRVALVRGLHALIFSGTGGDFGIKHGATSLIPAIT
jgi:hypothetical protein